jgi:cobalt-zinc-cadmium efflux system outer membrane protein
MSTFSLRAAASVAAVLSFTAAAAPLTLDLALDAAVQRSESTRSARAGVTSASDAAQAAAQLPDPTLRAGIDNVPVTGSDRLSTTRDSMTMKRIGISQEWLSADKRAARQAAAEAMVSKQIIAVRAAAADTRMQTALAYIDAYFARESLKLTSLMELHLHEEFAAARARLSAAAGSGQEVLALTGARGMAEDESADVRQQQATADVALRRWTGTSFDELSPLSRLPTSS